MRISKTRLSEIENLPDDTIDTSDIPELDDDFLMKFTEFDLKSLQGLTTMPKNWVNTIGN